MAKRYTRINWKNDATTALGATLLNRMDKGIKDCDDAIGDLALLNTNNKTDLVSAINEQNNNLAKLNTYRSIPLVTYTGDASAFENYSVNLPNRSFYEFELFMSTSHPVLGGGRYLVTGLKFTDPNQEIQQFISYANNSIKIYYRSKIGGVWGNFFAK